MVRVKICGITSLSDALFCSENGADALGFMFYKESSRRISPDAARDIIIQLPPFITTVAVFVNEDFYTASQICEYCGINIAQFHGDESADYVNNFNIRTIKAFRISDKIDENVMAGYNVEAYLLDSCSEGLYGGTGDSFNWEILRDKKFSRPVILAGGLDPENVTEAVEIVRPYAVDVSSGVEKEKGVKDLEKVKKFIIRAKHDRKQFK